MSKTVFVAAEIISGVFAGIFGVTAAYFTIRSSAQTEQEISSARNVYGRMWCRINSGSWSSLPLVVIGLLPRLEGHLASWLKEHVDHPLPQRIGFYGFPIVCLATGVLGFGVKPGLVMFIGSLIWMCISIIRKHLGQAVLKYAVVLPVFCSMLTGKVLIRWALSGSLQTASILLGLISPLLWFFWIVPASIMLEESAGRAVASSTSYKRFSLLPQSERLIGFGVFLAISLPLSTWALYFGHLLEPSAWVPLHPGVLYWNWFFDGITILVTLTILRVLLDSSSRFAVPVGIVVDVAFATVFACLSLWMGLKQMALGYRIVPWLATPGAVQQEVTIAETCNVLFGLSVDGRVLHLGPFFWLMHTAYIPTVLYLSAILFCWFAKLVYHPVNWILYRGKQMNPFGLTAAVFGLLCIVATFVSQIAKFIVDKK